MKQKISGPLPLLFLLLLLLLLPLPALAHFPEDIIQLLALLSLRQNEIAEIACDGLQFMGKIIFLDFVTCSWGCQRADLVSLDVFWQKESNIRSDALCCSEDSRAKYILRLIREREREIQERERFKRERFKREIQERERDSRERDV